MQSSTDGLTRRRFLKSLGCGVLSATPLLASLGPLGLAARAAAQSLIPGDDYRALVCILLAGGNDSVNMWVPADPAEHADYVAARSDLALPRESLLAVTPPSAGRDFGFHPSMPEMRSLFQQERLAVIQNVGPLVEPAAAPFASLDVAVPAAHGLRASQPYIVALMTAVVAIAPGHDVLILGVGGGYHAALARRLAARVYSVDLDADAVASVAARLEAQDYGDIDIRAADPYDGWPQVDRQFDAIIVRLAIDRVPPMLYRQLAPGGRLVAPIGRADDGQVLTLVTRGTDDSFATTPILPVRFMRLPGGERL